MSHAFSRYHILAELSMTAICSPTGENLDDLATARNRVGELTGGRYEVVAEIGRGGMSRVYLGWDRMDRRKVALKVLAGPASETVEGRERFRREALMAAQFDHPNIVPCDDFIQRGSLTLAVMRYVPGVSLAQRMGSGPWHDVPAFVAILIPLADALACVHRRGVIHRDVKPANILLRESDGKPFLTDFGIATLRTSEQSRSEVARKFGTPEYMSPEQAIGAWDADHRSDLYSLGLVAYHALAGRLPFRGKSPLAQAAQRSALDVPPLREQAPHVPLRLAAVIDRCLARDPRRRWRDAPTLRSALARAVGPRSLLRWLRAPI